MPPCQHGCNHVWHGNDGKSTQLEPERLQEETVQPEACSLSICAKHSVTCHGSLFKLSAVMHPNCHSKDSLRSLIGCQPQPENHHLFQSKMTSLEDLVQGFVKVHGEQPVRLACTTSTRGFNLCLPLCWSNPELRHAIGSFAITWASCLVGAQFLRSLGLHWPVERVWDFCRPFFPALARPA